MWGMYVGNKIDDETTALLLRNNDFHHNGEEDITEQYDYTGQRIQPWRPGWSEWAAESSRRAVGMPSRYTPDRR